MLPINTTSGHLYLVYRILCPRHELSTRKQITGDIIVTFKPWLLWFDFDFWCLMPLSTIFQYIVAVTDKFYHISCIEYTGFELRLLVVIGIWIWIWILVFQQYSSYIMATSFSGGGSRSTRREPPTLGKQLVNFITCGCESSAPFFVTYKSGREPTPYWW